MNKPKGGRGLKAPYRTVVIRVPEPIANKVESLCETYRTMSLAGEITQDDLLKFDSFGTNYSSLPKVTAIEEVNKLLRSKKSKRDTILKLLQLLYSDIKDGDIIKM